MARRITMECGIAFLAFFRSFRSIAPVFPVWEECEPNGRREPVGQQR
jgi:hypothetical protein